ncbi:MAG TPA: GNAT family N-acetyltransferase, partial [Gemmatimonadales bacterium]|nr:GNAT family N-acetyltransferase [Gemmatimonadales bacterium]
GLEPAESELAMAMALGEVVEPVLPIGLEIRRVTTSADLEAFAILSAANWDPPDRRVLRFYRTLGPQFLPQASPRHLFLGVHEGRPVATAELAGSGSTAGLYGISTLPDARRRGFGTAMTSAALHAAQAAGYTHAVLQAAPDGVGIYTRLGFVAEGEIVEYKPAVGR